MISYAIGKPTKPSFVAGATKIVTQTDVDNTPNPFKKGMFCRFKSLTQPIKELWQVHYVAEVLTKPEEMTFNWQGNLNNIKIVNLGPSNIIKRLDTASDYVELTQEELDALVTNNAVVLHRIKEIG